MMDRHFLLVFTKLTCWARGREPPALREILPSKNDKSRPETGKPGQKSLAQPRFWGWLREKEKGPLVNTKKLNLCTFYFFGRP
ncbi:hypothetical protein B0T26DRAFT_134190 [Lasiosphaeria miniovina]|uniref:Uncharacterized protein n=1 Tax=Lasiosphaeria miniovina TaxID=1954250 RepID=A0AA40B4G2_9PEZI|nr:uncharacterized protein B0T26DRAFT_134190 [Lasiosphaeria miniovina]KAK0727404.1 hypothetical protein B0T26DRAFT_134190 [Lasiosphaeria miniovina]